jgi:L-2-hydroxyglutarate oxidase LhgO
VVESPYEPLLPVQEMLTGIPYGQARFGPATPGVRGLVNLFGIESPGLTASLAVTDEVTAALAA